MFKLIIYLIQIVVLLDLFILVFIFQKYGFSFRFSQSFLSTYVSSLIIFFATLPININIFYFTVDKSISMFLTKLPPLNGFFAVIT